MFLIDTISKQSHKLASKSGIGEQTGYIYGVNTNRLVNPSSQSPVNSYANTPSLNGFYGFNNPSSNMNNQFNWNDYIQKNWKNTTQKVEVGNSGGNPIFSWIWDNAKKIGTGLLDNAENIGNLSKSILSWVEFTENKELMSAQRDAINEQIAASQEARQQRRTEIERLNRVRSNTKKSFNTNSVVTRSY